MDDFCRKDDKPHEEYGAFGMYDAAGQTNAVLKPEACPLKYC